MANDQRMEELEQMLKDMDPSNPNYQDIKEQIEAEKFQTLQEIHVTLEKHIAVSDERWKESILRIKRMEHLMIATSGTAIVMLIGLLVR